MGVNGWLLILSSFKPQYVLFSFPGHVSWNGMKEERKDKETSETFKTQLYYYRGLQLSPEGERPPSRGLSSFSMSFFFDAREPLLFPSMFKLFFLSEASWEIVISFCTYFVLCSFHLVLFYYYHFYSFNLHNNNNNSISHQC